MALTSDEQTKACCMYLNTFLFQNVWNESPSEYRVNFKLTPLRTTSAVSTFSVLDANIPLPDSRSSYFLWYFPTEMLHIKVQFDSEKWVDTATICNDWRTLFHLFGLNGKIFHKGSVYFRYNQSRTVMFVAVLKKAIKNYFNYTTDSLYGSVYYNSDKAKQCKVLSSHTSSVYSLPTLQKEAEAFLINHPDSQRVYFKDGEYVRDTSTIPSLLVDEYRDFIIDENVLFTFEVDLVDASENPVFLSEMDSTWKQLIHIPKSLNADNKILTHNTCEFFVSKWGSDTGVLLHRVTNGRTVGQVTHNDMSIPLFILDAYRDQLGSQEITIKVVVKRHENDNVLIRDANFIDLLYSAKHGDSDIVEFLTGKGDPSLSWWTAKHLEQSAYVKMMFDTPDIVSESNMTDYTAALGFYHTIDLLCRRIVDVQVASGFDNKIAFVVPLFYRDYDILPVVYIDGSVISSDYFTVSMNVAHRCVITFNKDVILPLGTNVSVVLFIDQNDTTYRFNITDEEYTFQIEYANPRVFIENTLSSGATCNGVSQASSKYYREISNSTGSFVVYQDEDGLNYITFNFSLSGNTVVIQSGVNAKRIVVDVNEYSSTGQTIAVPLTLNTVDGEGVVPMLNFENISLYLNRKYLNRGTDYVLNKVCSADGHTSFYEIIVQTMDYFVEGQNDILEIFTTMSEMEDISSGFAIDDQIRDDTPVNLYFPNISTLHINGKLVRDAAFHDVYFELEPDTFPQGANFEIQTSVPGIVRDFVMEYGTNTDSERLPILNEYFFEYGKLDPELLVLESKHRIYSVFVNTLMWKMMQGEIAIADDPDLTRLEAQIKDYAYLKDIDICYSDIDTRFVDFYPQYVNYEVTPEIKTLLDKFISIYAPTNNAPMMEVPYE